MVSVHLVKTTDRCEGTQKVLTMLEPAVKETLSAAKQPLIHPNLVHNERQLASVSADVAQVATWWIRKFSKQKIAIADGSYHGTKSAFANFGYTELAKNNPGVRLVDVNEDEGIEVPFYEPTHSLSFPPASPKFQRGERTRESDPRLREDDIQGEDLAIFSKTVAKADFRLTLAKAKTHLWYIMTASMKTTAYGSVIGEPSPYWRLVGKTVYSRTRWFHKDYQAGHKSLARLYGIYPADVVIIDGTFAMQGDGPTNGDPIELGWVLGSTNAPAADAVCAYLMGFEPNQIGYLVYANEARLGPINLNEIKIIGPHNWQTLRKKVVPPPNLEKLLQWRS